MGADLEAEWPFEVFVALVTAVARQARSDPAARRTMLRAAIRSLVAPPAGG